MRKTNIKQTLCGFFAAMMLISAISGISLALSEDGSPDYIIEQMDEVTINREKVNAKECNDTEAEPEFFDDDLVTVILVFDDNPVMNTAGTIKDNPSGYRTLTQKGSDIREGILDRQRAIINNAAAQTGHTSEIEIKYQYSLAFNGAAVVMPYGMLESFKSQSGIKAAGIAPEIEIPETDFEVGTSMVSSGDMVGAFDATAAGYDGSGQLIAVLDTGLYMAHDAFQTAPEKVKYTKTDIEKIFAENDLQAESRYKQQNKEDLTADMVYVREKIPYAFDYANRDCDVLQGVDDHGTHVAGIMVADPSKPCDLPTMEDKYIRGIAPKAQLCAMKVAGDTGGILWDNVIAALEDCILIGVDVANLSFGEIRSFPNLEEYQEKMFDRMYEAGINVSVSCGNAYNSGVSSTWQTSTNTTYNLENSMLSAPSVYRNVISTASVNSTHAYYQDAYDNYGYRSYISIDGIMKYYYDTAPSFNPDVQFKDAFGGRDVEYVVVPGYGMPEDYEGLDLRGRVALVKRGGITFQDKHIYAYNAGAAGLIIYNSTSTVRVIGLTIEDFRFPCVCVQLATGELLVSRAQNGVGTLHVSSGDPVYQSAWDSGFMSDFSSWGPLPDLTIKPELTAPGGNIISTVDINSDRGKGQYYYASESGTSMASPAVTASMAVIRQRVDEVFPDLSAQAKADLVYALAMTTAKPTTRDGVPYGVRRQGAGVVNVDAAVRTPAYITVDGQNHPKLELGDDPDRTGVYTLNFNVTNFSDSTVSYDISPILTVPAYQWVDQGYRATYVQKDQNMDCTDMMTFTSNMQNNRVTLSAGETKRITVTMTVNDEFRSLMSEVFKYGSYVEGYCRLLAVVGDDNVINPDLSVCYLGYYGSWCECPVVDQGRYYDDVSDWLTSVASPNTAGSKVSTLIYYELGVNPYYEWTEEFTFLLDRCSISPANGDRMFDSVDYFLTGIMRNLSKFYYRVYDPNDGTIYYEKVIENFAKDNDLAMTDSTLPTGDTLNKMKAWRGDGQSEGQTLYIRCGGEGMGVEWEESRAPLGYWEVPVTLDNTAPYVVESHSEGTKLYITISDNHYAAVAALYDNPTSTDDSVTQEAFAEFCICENERGAQTTIEVDMGGRETAYLLLGDYAANESQFKVTHTGTSHEDPTPTPSSVPTNEPELDGVYYQQTTYFTQGEAYVITARSGQNHYALTDLSSEGGLQGARVYVTDRSGRSILSGFATNELEWIYDNGCLVNAQSGKKLSAGDTLTADENGTIWSYEAAHVISGGQHLAYSGCFMLTPGGSAITVLRKVADTKDADALLTTNVRREGEKLYADVSFKTDKDVASGVIVLTYDADKLDFSKTVAGEMLGGFSVMTNDIIPGVLTIAFAGSQAIDADGGLLVSPEFILNDSVTNGTIIVFELSASELLLDDTVTDIKADASGASYVVSDSEPTPTPTATPTTAPTSEPTTTPTTAPTSQPTATPTSQPTATPTSQPTATPTSQPTATPTNQPTATPTTQPTATPTTAPTSQPTNAPTAIPTTVPGQPGTGDNSGYTSICLLVFGLSGVGYFITRRKDTYDEQ